MFARTVKTAESCVAADAHWRRSRRLLGAGLLLTAALKAAGMLGATWDPVGVFRAPGMLLLVVEVEFALAIWLLSGAANRACWVCTLLCFIALAAAAGYLWWVGEPACGCLGPVRAPPLAMLVLDVTAIALLSASRPHRFVAVRPSPGASRALVVGTRRHNRWRLCHWLDGNQLCRTRGGIWPYRLRKERAPACFAQDGLDWRVRPRRIARSAN